MHTNQNHVSLAFLVLGMSVGCTASEGPDISALNVAMPSADEHVEGAGTTPGGALDGGNDGVDGDGQEGITVPDFDVPYAFDSRFQDGSSVQYTDAIVRQALICEMKFELGELTEAIDAGMDIAPGQVQEMLEFYYFFPEEGCEIEFLAAPRNALQTTVSELECGANLHEAMAGNSPLLAHTDGSNVLGWDVPGVTTPESLMRHWLGEIDDAAVARATAGEAPSRSVFLSEDGVDRQQLLEKFLQAAVTFAPAAAGHLGTDVPGQGLLADNTTAYAGAATALESGWDEAYGYFGAHRTFGLQAAMDIKAESGQDVDGDGLFDLTQEFAWGGALLVAKRDVNVAEPLDLVGDAWQGFLGGRAIIAGASGPDGALTPDEQRALEEYAQQALDGWEAGLAATAVRHINKALQQLAYGVASDDRYKLKSYGKAWSQAKGFTLGFQFNPRSRMSEDDFAALHALLGIAPILPDGDAAAFQEDLIGARALLAEVYSFPEVNLGDDDGANGW